MCKILWALCELGSPKYSSYNFLIVVLRNRKEGLRNIDVNKTVRISCENTAIKKLYEEYLGEPNSHKAHKILHTTYKVEK